MYHTLFNIKYADNVYVKYNIVVRVFITFTYFLSNSGQFATSAARLLVLRMKNPPISGGCFLLNIPFTYSSFWLGSCK